MARGPLPSENARRRNSPTIPTTNLPVSGRKGRPPKPPEAYALGKAGAAWWKWAWTLPQAMAWDAGAFYSIARRAQLEDDLAILDTFDPFDLAELLGLEENDALRHLGWVIGRLKGMAGGRVTVLREMRELDNKLGLNPAAMAALRWKIVDDKAPTAAAPVKPKRQSRGATVHRLRAIDPDAAAG